MFKKRGTKAISDKDGEIYHSDSKNYSTLRFKEKGTEHNELQKEQRANNDLVNESAQALIKTALTVWVRFPSVTAGRG